MRAALALASEPLAARSGLEHWQPDASHIITHLTDFFDWLGEMRPDAAKVNPRYAGGAYDRQTDETAYQYRRNKAFLGHTWAENASPR